MKLALSLLIALFSSFSFAGPIIVGGAGESEYSLVFVHKNLNVMIQDCLDVGCSLSGAQRTLLLSISKSQASSWNPIFKDSKELTALFQLQTTRKEVWINRDLLWLDTSRTVSYGVADALRLWIEILGTYLAVDSKAAQDVARIAADSLKNQIQRGGVSLEDQQTFEFLLWMRGTDFRFQMRDPGLQSINLSDYLNATNLQCASEVSNLQIYSPVWVPLTARRSDRTLNVTLHFGISWTCESRFFNTNALFFAEAIRDQASTIWMLDPNSLGIFVSIEK